MRIGPYETEGTIGEGGDGTVYRSRASSGEPVAVKVLKRTTPEQLARFDRERRLLATLGAEAGFVPLLDAGQDRGTFYVVMPFVPGETLRARIKRGPLRVDQALAIVRAVALAVGRAHALGIVHRDLKPENILFDADGRPLVADLGIAKHYDRSAPGASQSASITHGSWRGTVGYMAPEQFDNRHVGPGTDVFALGAILFECLAGQRAFPGDTPVETLARVASGKVEKLSRFRKDVPPAIDAAITRAVAPDPATRFPDGIELARALAEIAPSRSGRNVIFALVSFAATLAVATPVVVLIVRKKPSAPAVVVAPPTTPRPPSPPPPKPSAPTPPRPSPQREQANALVEEGRTLYFAQKLPEAKEKFDQALEVDSSCARAWAARAVLKISYRDPRGAIVDATRAIELEPTQTDGWNNRAVAKRELGDHAAALLDFEKVLELAPSSATSWSNRAYCRMQLNDLEGAEKDFDRALELEPGDAISHHSRAGLRARRGELAGACEDFERFVELAPEHPAAGEVREWIARNRAGRSALAGEELVTRRGPVVAAALIAVALGRASAEGELTLEGVLDLLGKKTPAERVVEQIKESGLRVALSGEDRERLRKAGATETVVAALDRPRLTKSAVVALAKGGTSGEELVKRIRESDSRFELTIDQALALGDAGVPAAAIREIKARPLRLVEIARGRVRIRAPHHWWALPEQKAEDGTTSFVIDCRIEGTPFRAARLYTIQGNKGISDETLNARGAELFQAVIAKQLAAAQVQSELEPGPTVAKRDGLAVLSGHMRCSKGEEKAHGSFVIAAASDAIVFGWFLAGRDDLGEERALADAAIASLKVAPPAKEPREPGHGE